MNQRPLTDRDRAFLERHRKLRAEDPGRPTASTGDRKTRIFGHVRAATASAIKVEAERGTAWLPKSQAKIVQSSGSYAEIEAPQWLLMKEGLI